MYYRRLRQPARDHGLRASCRDSLILLTPIHPDPHAHMYRCIHIYVLATAPVAVGRRHQLASSRACNGIAAMPAW